MNHPGSEATEEDKARYEADVQKLRAVLNPVISQGSHPAALLYVGGMMVAATAHGLGWSLDNTLAHVVALYESATLQAEPTEEGLPSDVTIH